MWCRKLAIQRYIQLSRKSLGNCTLTGYIILLNITLSSPFKDSPFRDILSVADINIFALDTSRAQAFLLYLCAISRFSPTPVIFSLKLDNTVLYSIMNM